MAVKSHKNGKIQFNDKLILFSLPAIAVLGSLYFRTSFLVSTVLFFGLLAVWLSIRLPSRILKSLVFSLVLAVPVSIMVDYIGVMNGAWYVPESIVSFRLFDVVPLEDILWGFLLVYNPVMFYCNFFDPGSSKIFPKKLWLPVIFSAFAALFVVFTVNVSPEILSMEYAYLWLGTLILGLPLLLFILKYPRFIRTFIKIGAYFFVIGLLFELVSLKLGHWIFPGDGFVGWVHLFGQSMPTEEFVFWFVLCSSSTLSYYLFFDTDLA